MKVLFIFILVIHSLIHLIGFLKGFKPIQIPNLKMQIKKKYAIIWLISSLLFLITALLFIFKIDSWQISLLISVIISQSLIIKYWRDARFGTIINIIAFIILLPSLANSNFEYQTKKEILEFKKKALSKHYIENYNNLNTLPKIVQKWIKKSRILDKKGIKLIELKQKGKMKIDKQTDWSNFTATQYFNPVDPSFIWVANVEMNSFIFFRGKDKLENGIGQMQIKILSFIDIVNIKNNNKINSGAMLRYLAEMICFPEAAMKNYCNWESLSDTIVKTTFTYAGVSVNGNFCFSKDGDFKYFITKRFYGADEKSKEELWEIKALGYKEFNGIRIPYKCHVTWKLKEGNFTWLILEIKEINYFN